MSTKDTNPKDAVGSTKVPLSLIPLTARVPIALAHLDGALKYGKWNWRAAGVRTSIYLDAIERHLGRINEGEWIDNDSGLPHLAHIGACVNILLDAAAQDKLIDDRPPSTHPQVVADLLLEGAKRVLDMRAKYAHLEPHHHTIEDGR